MTYKVVYLNVEIKDFDGVEPITMNPPAEREFETLEEAKGFQEENGGHIHELVNGAWILVESK